MSAFEGIVLQNSAGFDCSTFMSSGRPLVCALPFVCCSSYSQVSTLVHHGEAVVRERSIVHRTPYVAQERSRR